ncbi:hypothetical protein HG531_004242 [Fusarium graminearum]|nr:hypothetical protein HG531_004242 [Fusarium graminearum]
MMSWLVEPFNSGGFLAHLLSLEVAFQRVKEQAIMGDAVPVKDFLLLLSSDAVVLVKEVEEGALGLLQRSISSRLEVPQVREDTLLEFLRVLDRSAESLESEGQASHDVGARNVEEVVPENA